MWRKRFHYLIALRIPTRFEQWFQAQIDKHRHWYIITSLYIIYLTVLHPLTFLFLRLRTKLKNSKRNRSEVPVPNMATGPGKCLQKNILWNQTTTVSLIKFRIKHTCLWGNPPWPYFIQEISNRNIVNSKFY